MLRKERTISGDDGDSIFFNKKGSDKINKQVEKLKVEFVQVQSNVFIRSVENNGAALTV